MNKDFMLEAAAGTVIWLQIASVKLMHRRSDVIPKYFKYLQDQRRENQRNLSEEKKVNFMILWH